VIAGLHYLVDKRVEVTCVVASPGHLADAAAGLGIPVLDHSTIYEAFDRSPTGTTSLPAQTLGFLISSRIGSEAD
jgi:hypothetical protein